MTDAEKMAERLEGFIVETEEHGRGLRMAIDFTDVEEAAALLRAQAAEIVKLMDALEGSTKALESITETTQRYRDAALSRIGELEEALRPFACEYDLLRAEAGPIDDDQEHEMFSRVFVFRRARTALERT